MQLGNHSDDSLKTLALLRLGGFSKSFQKVVGYHLLVYTNPTRERFESLVACYTPCIPK